jgi:hypothetical protein
LTGSFIMQVLDASVQAFWGLFLPYFDRPARQGEGYDRVNGEFQPAEPIGTGRARVSQVPQQLQLPKNAEGIAQTRGAAVEMPRELSGAARPFAQRQDNGCGGRCAARVFEVVVH